MLLHRALLATLIFSPVAAAQSEYVAAGGVPDYEIRRTIDLDGDGLYLSAGEGVSFGNDAQTLLSYAEDLAFAVHGVPTVYFTESNSDILGGLVDLDGDGVCTGVGELFVAYDFTVHGASSPDGIGVDPNTGVVYVTDDIYNNPISQPGIHRLEDLNGDGDYLDAGEWTLFVDGFSTTTTVPDNGGTLIDVGDFEAIMVDSNGTVIAFAQQDRMLYAFNDLNGDGDAMDPGEATNWCNIVDDVAGLDVNADLLAGTLIPPRCPSTSGVGFYATLESLSVGHGAGPAGEDVYYIGSNAGTSCSAATGLLYQAIDLNGDGDVNDPAEVTLFVDGPITSINFPLNSLYDVTAADGGVAVFTGNGPMGANYTMDTINLFVDGNADGDAMDPGEGNEVYHWAPDGCYALSLASMPQGAFAPPSVANFVPFGTPGTTTSGTQPRIGNIGLPEIGALFDVTLSGGEPFTACMLALGFSNTTYTHNNGATFGLPLALDFVGATGNTLYTSIDMEFTASVTSTGDSSVALLIPNNPAYAGFQFYVQWIDMDLTGNAFGKVFSDAAECTIN